MIIAHSLLFCFVCVFFPLYYFVCDNKGKLQETVFYLCSYLAGSELTLTLPKENGS